MSWILAKRAGIRRLDLISERWSKFGTGLHIIAHKHIFYQLSRIPSVANSESRHRVSEIISVILVTSDTKSDFVSANLEHFNSRLKASGLLPIISGLRSRALGSLLPMVKRRLQQHVA